MKSKNKNRPNCHAPYQVEKFGPPTLGIKGNAPGGDSTTVRHIELLMEAGKFKTALSEAKDCHKKLNNEQSKQLLILAYLGRIEQMREMGMHKEAQALIEVVEHRYPQTQKQLNHKRLVLSCQAGQVGPVLKQWQLCQDPAERQALEEILRRDVTDLAFIAKCDDVDRDHPIRHAAEILQHTFEAVTSRTVSESELDLSAISRRNPLACWKSLIRAIAAFYEHEDAVCRKFLELIKPDSAAAKLIPAMRAMLMDKPDTATLSVHEKKLADAVCDSNEPLREFFEALDAGFRHRDRSYELIKMIRRAIGQCRAHQPDLVETLKKHISVLAAGVQLDVSSTIQAMGGTSVHDAYWWRLWSCFCESAGQSLYANSCWDRFLKHAVCEKWFVPDGSETAMVYQRMIENFRHVSPASLEDRMNRPELFSHSGLYEDQPDYVKEVFTRYPDMRDNYFLNQFALCERLCHIEPTRPHFRQWLQCSESRDDYRLGELAAKSWSLSFPEDSEPLLFLAESAEERGAFSKALKYVEQAEHARGYEPRVKTARLRLLIAKTFRHAKEAKAHLIDKDLIELRQLPLMQQDPYPILLEAFEYLNCFIAKTDTEPHYRRLSDRLEGSPGGDAYLYAVCRAAGRYQKMAQAPKGFFGNKMKLRSLITGISAMAQTNIAYSLPQDWHHWLSTQIKKMKSSGQVSPQVLMGFGKAVVFDEELAFHTSRLMFHDERCSLIDALILRGCSIPDYVHYRREQCFRAAMELARRQGDIEKLSEIVETMNKNHLYYPFGGFDSPTDRLGPEDIERIIDNERSQANMEILDDDFFGPDDDDWDDDDDFDDPLDALWDDSQDDDDAPLPRHSRPGPTHKQLPLFYGLDDIDDDGGFEDDEEGLGSIEKQLFTDENLEEIMKQAPPHIVEKFLDYFERNAKKRVSPPVEVLEYVTSKIMKKIGKSKRK